MIDSNPQLVLMFFNTFTVYSTFIQTNRNDMKNKI